MGRVALTQADLEQAARRQVGFLQRSAQAFDDGEPDEAVRMAVALRVMLHDTNRSTSLLQQLRLKSKLMFFDTSLEAMLQLLASNPEGEEKWLNSGPDRLADHPIGRAPTWPPSWFAPLREATLESRPRQAFDEWWRTPFIKFGIEALNSPDRLSRWDVVAAMAHQDGGAHVDPRGLDERYARLVRGVEGTTWSAVQLPGKAAQPQQPFAGNAAACTVRQICFEFLHTLKASAETAGLLSSDKT